ncbi:MAG: CaiB/BaiF CoA transferase family protein [Burkholderiaceae bacterium]
MSQVLSGYKVVDFTHVLAGPIATNYLCLHGAEVIKIESQQGDAMRNYAGDGPPKEGGIDFSPSFVSVNTGKRSIVLDLKLPEHKKVALKLIAQADVVVENFRSGVMDRLGLGFEVCKKIKPDIVFCSISGFGQTGPLKNNPALDQIIQSMSGLMTLSGEEGSASMRIGFPIVDTFTGTLAAMAIVMALLRRERIGKGQFIDIAMLDAAMTMMVSVAGPLLVSGVKPKKTGNLGYSKSPTADTFPTGDGEITLGVTRQDQFEKLCSVIGRKDLISDKRFLDKWARQRNGGVLRGEIILALTAHSSLEWERLLNSQGIAASSVRDLPGAIDHPHFQHRQMTMSAGLSGDANSAKILNTGFQFMDDPASVYGPPPKLGAHTRQILTELGYDAEEISSIAGGIVQ